MINLTKSYFCLIFCHLLLVKHKVIILCLCKFQSIQPLLLLANLVVTIAYSHYGINILTLDQADLSQQRINHRLYCFLLVEHTVKKKSCWLDWIDSVQVRAVEYQRRRKLINFDFWSVLHSRVEKVSPSPPSRKDGVPVGVGIWRFVQKLEKNSNFFDI